METWDGAGLSRAPGLSLGAVLERREAALEVVAHELVEVHDEAERLHAEAVLTVHRPRHLRARAGGVERERRRVRGLPGLEELELQRDDGGRHALLDRKSTRLNSSHQIISYAVFCLKKKKHNKTL